MIEYILLGIVFPILLNLVHLVMGVYVVVARGSVMSLGFTGVGFLTKSIGMIFLTWLGVGYLGLDMKIFIPIRKEIVQKFMELQRPVSYN